MLRDRLDLGLTPTERCFLYLPFEHSESLADQDRSVALMSALAEPMWGDYAERHRQVIARFGRFPHRNAVLGRETTADDVEGWDSLMHVRLTVATEMEFGHRFDTAEINALRNVGDFVDLIASKA